MLIQSKRKDHSANYMQNTYPNHTQNYSAEYTEDCDVNVEQK